MERSTQLEHHLQDECQQLRQEVVLMAEARETVSCLRCELVIMFKRVNPYTNSS